MQNINAKKSAPDPGTGFVLEFPVVTATASFVVAFAAASVAVASPPFAVAVPEVAVASAAGAVAVPEDHINFYGTCN